MYNWYKLKRFIRLYGSWNTAITLMHKIRKRSNKGLTIIITSSGRVEYLQETLMTLKKCLITKRQIFWHIIDDNPNSDETRKFIIEQNFDCIIFNKKNEGLGYSLNRIYRTVKTRYIFHCEDDWKFVKPFDIDQLINELCPSEQLILNREQLYKTAPKNRNGKFYLSRYYSFNPHLVDSDSVKKLLPFSNENTERTVSDKARNIGIDSRIFNYNLNVYVSHIGHKKSVQKY